MSQNSGLLVYKASAGSGKTFTLTVEYIKLLVQDPRAYRHILAVTFTNKATAEMKDRILSQLYGIWTVDKDSDPYLENVCKGLEMNKEEVRRAAGKALNYMIHDYSRFRVETIDSFFQSVMRNLARELELSPNLNIELNNDEVLSDAVDSMIEKLDRNSPVLLWLLDYIEERIREDKRWNVSNEVKGFGRSIFDERYIEKGAGLRAKLKDKDCIRNYKKKLKTLQNDALEQMKGFAGQFFGTLETHGLAPEDLKNGTRGISSYFNKIQNGILGDDIRNASVEKSLESEENWSTKTSPQKAAIQQLAAKELIPLLQSSEEFRAKNNKIANSCSLSLRHLNKVRLLSNVDEEVRELNRKNNRFLLSDTNALLRSLVGHGDSSFVFEKIGTSIQNVMIDEFQDTSRMQWGNFKILLLEALSQGAGSLIVGDVKQSIYRWRNGDWSILNGLKDHIEAFPIRIETLKTNRRSEANIIRFNNLLFTEACNFLNGLHKKESGKDCEELKNAYQDVCQESPQKEEKGYVKVQFLGKDEDLSYEEGVLDAMKSEVERLMAEGVRQADISILVRKNKMIPIIADYFDKHLPYKIVSDQAFRLDASLAICMMVDGLRYLSNPQNMIACAQLVIGYQNKILQKTTDLNTLLLNNMTQYLPQAFLQKQGLLRLMPLYELLEELFSIFEMNKIKGQDAYLFAFFDAVVEYLQNNSSGIDLFVTHWEEELCHKTIPSGEIEGIRIMSIHKSKGLEFHTVLIPFCDWKLENETNNQWVWCAPGQAPFNDLDIIPVNYSSAMEQSIYRQDYLNERLQLWVDNLNLLYVALTRAKKNLIIWSKAKQKNTVAELLYQSVEKIASADKAEWGENEPYEYGELCPSQESKKKESTNKLTILPDKLPINMESLLHNIEFKQSNRSAYFIEGEEHDASGTKYIDQGKLLHRLFSVIEIKEDIPNAISQLVIEGVIESQEAAEKIRKLAEWALDNPKASEWYSGTYRLFNECAIIYKENGTLQTRRPDRVMTKGDKVIVVDFKFGKKNEDYRAQVKGYMSLLSQMGYRNVTGYLWYVFENELEEIG